MIINYQKRKNTKLFQSLEDYLFISNLQNYIPIYTKFFQLRDNNYNNINLNNKWFIYDINGQNNFKIKNIDNNIIKNANIFFKLAPLLDPYKYLIGKYNINDKNIFTLPKLNSNETNCHPKFINLNNCAYVDGFFLYLTSNLIYNYNFIHGVDYYGSFLGLKKNFITNIYDDIDNLNNSDFFYKNKNILFTIDDYEHLIKTKLKPIVISHNISNSQLSIQSFNSDFSFNYLDNNINSNINKNIHSNKNITLQSNSSCSSRSSYDSNDSNNSNDFDDDCYDSDYDEEEEEEEEIINANIPEFPVQVIAMEYCDNTFDYLILNNKLTSDEWFSALMQIIMILITYQKLFAFTHNDLHTNNIMYNKTDKQFIYYFYQQKYYKVPTFGRIFKIIDFGRSIYKFDNKLFCSDSFQIGGDAATQYNTEPFFNHKKPRLEPNFSFDLCRLACSMFNNIIDFEEIKDIYNSNDPVKRIIFEWCLDDNGINILYKNNGSDRYPDFKLYKMIARCVHKHTPQLQLERPEFNTFLTFDKINLNDVINIDNMPSFVFTK